LSVAHPKTQKGLSWKSAPPKDFEALQLRLRRLFQNRRNT
jgi:hypothetical protein